MNGWLALTVAILSEVVGTIALRQADGFRRPIPSIIVVVGYAISFYMLSKALKDVPIGIAYAVWSGVGTAIITVVGVTAFDERLSMLKVGSIALIIGGVVGLAIAEPGH